MSNSKEEANKEVGTTDNRNVDGSPGDEDSMNAEEKKDKKIILPTAAAVSTSNNNNVIVDTIIK
jgi:hypothetical protein